MLFSSVIPDLINVVYSLIQ